MPRSLRPAVAGAVLVVLLLLVPARPLYSSNRWDGPPFSTDPKVLLQEAGKLDTKDAAVLYLLDEATVSFEADGRARTVSHQIRRVVTAAGVESAGTASAWWAPWYDARPTIQARVIAGDGLVHQLDPKAVVEATAEEESDLFSDERVVRAPLPGVAVGSIVETVVTIEGRSPIAGAGKYGLFTIGGGAPVEESRLTLDSPAGVTPRVVNKTGLEPRSITRDGRTIVIFEKGHTDTSTDEEAYLPADEMRLPYIAYSTGTSWHDIAQHYGEIVDKQMEGSDLKAAAASALGGVTERREVIDRLLAYVARNVRYAGVEVGDGSIVPRAPHGVLQNKYGDCKDKATLLVALLRTAGIPAHVALLQAGSGFDVIPSLPGADRFNHAIVAVDGPTPLWIDPTDELARAGELPPQDQGRLALIASPSTVELTRTPELTAAQNRYTEARTFTLPEEGRAHVIEVTEGFGAQDSSLRHASSDSDQKKYREALERYAKSYYVASALESATYGDAHDLSKPFRLTLEVLKSKSGVVASGEADVAIPISGIVSHLPEVLRDYEEPSAEAEKAKPAKKRVHDFQFPEAMTKEWTYRIVPAAGYAPRTLPQSETTRLGTASLTTAYRAETDGTVVATLRFDSGKRRLTAAEFEETRIAISKLSHHKQVDVGFELLGQTRLNAGDIRGALTEFRRLAELHPKEAQHHVELARALLAGGLGEMAREEARRAVAVEPSSAKAHTMLAHVLEHDLLGRPFHKGCDLAGAVAELRKAKALDATDSVSRIHLAELLTYGDGDFRFGHHAHLDQSIEEYTSLIKDLGKEGEGQEPPLMLVLAYAGRWDEVKKRGKSLATGQQHDLFQVLSTAATDGSAAAIRELGAFEVETRRQYAASVSQTLIGLRMYAPAADLLEAAAQGSPKANQILPAVQILRKAKPYQSTLDDSPRSLMLKLMAAMVAGDREAAGKLFLPELRGHLAESDVVLPLRKMIAENMTPDGMLDLVAAGVTLQQDGSADLGYRFRLRSDSVSLPGGLAFYVQIRDGKPLLAAFGDEDDDSLGAAALQLANSGKLEAARTWLNWIRELVTAGGGDDPLAGPPFAKLWQKEKSAATLDEIRVAAASLMTSKEYAAQAAAILAPVCATAASDRCTPVQMALTSIYRHLRDWPKLLAVAEPLAKANPESGTAFLAWAGALARNGRAGEAEAAASARLARLPRDREALRALSDTAARRGDYDAAEKWARMSVDATSPLPEDFNQAAWVALFLGRNLDQAIDDARHASSAAKGPEAWASLHTLAALFADSGRSTEARQALLDSLDHRPNDQPTSSDWFVLGRIAENYGVAEAALAAYKRVDKQEEDGLTTWELTQRRLKAMAVKP